mgnify:CR=1 FL=1
MRMKELVVATGLPRTAIHHYQREGLLPPATKTAANAAIYGSEHVDRLKLIQALRTDEMGPFPLSRVRTILEMIDSGVEPELAAALHSLPGDLRPRTRSELGRFRNLAEVAHAAGLEIGVARALVEAGLLIAAGETADGRVYDGADVAAARTIAAFLDGPEIGVADLEPIAELAAETERYEQALIGLATARMEPEAATERRHSMYRSLHALHAYLHVRLTAAHESDLE